MTYETRFTWWDVAKLTYAGGVIGWVVVDWNSYFAFCGAVSAVLFGVLAGMAKTVAPVLLWTGRTYLSLWQ